MNRKLNVLHITSWYPTRERPFAETFIQDHVRAVSPRVNSAVLHLVGANGDITSRWACHYENDAIIDDLPVYRVLYRPPVVPFTSALIYFFGVFRTWQKIQSQKFRPDLIHAHSYKGGAVAAAFSKWSQIPLVVSEQSSGFLQKSLAGKKLWQARLAFNAADLILPVSTSLKKGIAHYISNAEYHVLPNVVGEMFFQEAGKSLSLEPPQTIQRLSVGHLRQDHIKGLPYLFKALALSLDQHGVPDWHLTIVGDGPSRAEYEQMVASLNLQKKVTFLGQLPRESIADLMTRSQFFVVSSLHETFSVVAVEALAVGLPVLATRCGGPEDFINSNVGILVEPGDVTALYDGLCYMLVNWQKFSRQANSRYARNLFSAERIGMQLHKVYTEVVAKHQSGDY